MINTGLKILIVDDSSFFRRRIAEIIDSTQDMCVVGTAADGQDAILKAAQLGPDLITMDVQMPVVDGLSAVRRIMMENPTRILMLSALTSEGARVTLEALEAGAVDFMPKESGGGQGPGEEFAAKMLEKIRAVSRSRAPLRPREGLRGYRASIPMASRQAHTATKEPTRLVVIGASTGGPVALQTLLSGLPRSFPLPILVAVHMPGSFTSAYAERLNTLCAIKVSEATDHSHLRPGQALIAPGGKQMIIDRGASAAQVRIKDALPEDVYHPSVDQLFSSAASAFGGQVLGLVLTGMGSDGLKGSRQLKRAGARLWSQDEKSCVVYGMPHAVEGAGLSDRVLSIDAMVQQLVTQR